MSDGDGAQTGSPTRNAGELHLYEKGGGKKQNSSNIFLKECPHVPVDEAQWGFFLMAPKV